jgi:hypothetical protein
MSYEALRAQLPEKPLYAALDAEGLGWPLAPEPYPLKAHQLPLLEALGPALWRYQQACQQLYKLALTDATYGWLKALFHKGKPSWLMTFSEMKRIKNHQHLVIRPDLLVTPDGFALTEMENAAPAGIGFTTALQAAYQALGFKPYGWADLPDAFLQMLVSAYRIQYKGEKETPSIALLVSEDFNDYRREFEHLVAAIKPNYEAIVCIRPAQMTLRDRDFGYLDDSGAFHPLDIVYRMFELYDLPNIAQVELLQYAIKKNLVFFTPPYKPYLEEKFTLALIHSPGLEHFWEKELGSDHLALLQRVIPPSWILDSTPLPFQAYIEPALRLGNKRHKDFSSLSMLTQKERQLVVKPSSFSHLAWGSHGVTVGHDVPQEHWQQAVQNAMDPDNGLVYLMQQYSNPAVEPYRQFDPKTGEAREREGRTRLCPYYFIIDNEPQLVGVLTTTCPKDKKVIHGMRDGVMRPAYIPQA